MTSPALMDVQVINMEYLITGTRQASDVIKPLWVTDLTHLS